MPTNPTNSDLARGNVTLAAAAIIDCMMGGKTDWRNRLHESDFLESADWQTAYEYARAALQASRPVEDVERVVNALRNHLLRREGLALSDSQLRDAAAAVLSSLQQSEGALGTRLRTEFLPGILHGDEAHRAWLTEAVDCFLTGRPLPPPTASLPTTPEYERGLRDAVKVARDIMAESDERLKAAPDPSVQSLIFDSAAATAERIAVNIEALMQSEGEGR